MNRQPLIKLELTAAVVEWLRYKSKCLLVATERGLSPDQHKPDVFGVYQNRQAVEVEIKITLADFKADAGKRHIANREHSTYFWPQRFYYAVPPEMVEHVKPIRPNWAGLLSLGEEKGWQPNRPIVCIVGSPMNRDAQKVSIYNMARMAKHLTGSLSRMHGKLFAIAAEREA